MPNTFPSDCDPAAWTGTEAEHLAGKPGPLFQRLLSDALLVELPGQVEPSSLEGVDGKVDILIRSGVARSRVFRAPYPAIVECKFHETGNQERREREWKGVFHALRVASENGWKNVSAEWQTAHSYIYCISHALKADSRAAMARLIAEQLATLRRLDGTPLALEVQVVTWAELVPWLNGDRFRSLRDRWLGVRPPWVVSRDVYRRELVNFRRWLDSERLPFVDPDPSAPFHRQAVFEEVRARIGGAVVLHGPGGIGKTRTAFEVGALAAAANWRVLHVVRREKDVDADTLFREVGGASDTPALVIYDYLDQATAFSLHDFLALVRADDVPVVVLGTARRMESFRHLVNEQWVWPVKIAPDARHASEICAAIHDHVSGEARAFFGEEVVARACGQRPILALLIAEELNRRAANRNDDLSHIRGDNPGLTAWLDLRLRADAYGTPPPAEEIDRRRIAAASVLAAAPQRREALVDVARIVMQHCGAPALSAAEIVNTLTKAGWLEEEGQELAVVHDVVTDDILETLLVDDESGTVRDSYLDAVLVPALHSARTLGRFAQSLGRLCAEQLRAANAQEHIEKSARIWFEDHAAALGSLVSNAKDAGTRDVAGYGVGAVLASRVWGDTLVQQWNVVVRPWLEANKTEAETRHVLYRALKIGVGTGPLGATIVAQSIDWLAEPANHTKRHASFIAGELIERLDDAGLATIEPYVTTWLRAYATDLPARFVILSLLRRRELAGALRTVTLTAGEEWLRRRACHATAPAVARVFLRAAPPDQSDRVRHLLVTKIAEQVRMPRGRSRALVRFLLDLVGSDAEAHDAIAAALEMLAAGLAPSDAVSLVIGMLRLPSLGASHDDVLRAAIDWIGGHAATRGAATAVASLLERRDLGSFEKEAMECALDWVAREQRTQAAGRVFAALLDRPLGTGERPLVELAMKWLTRHRRTEEAGALLSRLLRAETLGSRVHDVSSIALDWVVRYRESAEAQFIIEATANVKDDLRKRFARLALDRLEDLEHGPGATYSARWLAQNMSVLGPGQMTRFVRVVVNWLEEHRNDTDIDFVSKPILRGAHVRDSSWQRVAAVTVAMMRRRGFTPQDDYPLQSLAERFYLLAPDDLQFVRERLDEYERLAGRLWCASRLRSVPVRRELLLEALADPEPPRAMRVRLVCDELSHRMKREVLNRHSDVVPLAALLAWRCTDARARREALAQLRSDVLSTLHLEHAERHRLQLGDHVERIGAERFPPLPQILESLGLSDRRLELRRLFDAGLKQRDLAGVSVADVTEALEAARRDLKAGVGADGARLFARVLPYVVACADDSVRGAADGLGHALRRALTEDRAKGFLEHCRAKLREAGMGADADLICSRYGIERKTLLAIELNRIVDGRAPASPEKVHAAVDFIRARIARGHAVGAGFVFEPAIIVAIRESYDELVQELVAVGAELLPALHRGTRDKLRRQLYRGVQSSWPLYARGRRVYAELGLDDWDLLVNVGDDHLQHRRGVPDEGLLALLREGVVRHLADAERHPYAIVCLRCLMALTTWRFGELPPEVRVFVRDAIGRFDGAVRRDFARHAFDDIAKARWPDAAKAEQELLALGLEDPENHVLERRLAEWLEQRDRALTAADLVPFLAAAEQRLERGNPGHSGYLLVPLLPLAARAGDAAFEARVHDLVRAQLDQSSTFRRAGFRNKSEHLLDDHAWPSRDLGEITLQRLSVSFRRIVRLATEGGPVPAAELRAALAASEPMLADGRADDLAGGIAAIFAVALRGGTGLRQAQELWNAFVRLPETTREDVDRVTMSVRDLVASGACGDRARAQAALEEVGVTPMRMKSLLEDPSLPVPRDVVRSGVRTADAILTDAWSRRVGDYVQYLIPLSTRTGDAALEAAVDQLVLRVREHPRLNADFVKGIGRRCEEGLKTAPDREAAQLRLRRLQLVM